MCHQPSCFGKLNTGQNFEDFEDLREERNRQTIDSTVVTLDISEQREARTCSQPRSFGKVGCREDF